MDELYPIIRRVRRPLTMKLVPAAPAVPAVALNDESASMMPVADVGRSSTSDVEGEAEPATVVDRRHSDSLRVIDRRVDNNERKERHGGKASTKKKA